MKIAFLLSSTGDADLALGTIKALEKLEHETLLTASYYYADDYSIHLTSDDLEQIAQPNYTTHRAKWAERARAISQFLLIPFRKSLQLFARSLQPSPGENKDVDSIFKAWPLRLLAAGFAITSLFISFAFALVMFPFHLAALVAYKKRPVMSYINNAKPEDVINKSEMSAEKPLHVRTHNVGFVLESMGIIGDLRWVIDRAKELVDFVINDEAQPDIICFQETFHEDGTRILCDGLKSKYPYIIANVLPTASGFNSGAMIASKYPILDVSFHCLKHNIGLERLAPRGMLRIKIETQKGPVNIYQAHTQSLLGKNRAEAREKQLVQIKQIMEEDFKKDKLPQMMMGDLNTSEIDAWGNSNMSDPRNPEVAVQKRLHEEFDDLYLKGPMETFLRIDNKRAKLEKPLAAAKGTWYAGLFPKDDNVVNKGIHAKIEQDRQEHNYTVEPVVPIEDQQAIGTKEWRDKQPANTARFDYITFLRCTNEKAKLNGRAEIRRVYVPEGQQSAASDHLPVDGLIWQARP